MREKIKTAVSFINMHTNIKIKSYTLESSGFTIYVDNPIEIKIICSIDENIVGTEYELISDILEFFMIAYTNHLYGDLGGDLYVEVRRNHHEESDL